MVTRCVDESPYALVARCLEERPRALDVHLDDPLPHVLLAERREVHDVGDAVHREAHGLAVRDAPRDDRHVLALEAGARGRVEHDVTPALARHPVEQHATDDAGAARDENGTGHVMSPGGRVR
jgi:hypothetical protein